MRIIHPDNDNWPRRHHFHFFRQFDEPFFGVCVEMDCTTAYRRSRELRTSYFLYYLHKSVAAANQIEAFRYRIESEYAVIVHDQVHASATIDRENGTFGFSYIPYAEDYAEFEEGAKKEIARVRSTDTLTPATSSENVIHYSSLPWIRFSSISHARNYGFKDSSPKICFGKLTEDGGKMMMPVSVHGHHALMDGRHIGEYCDLFQKLLNT